MTDINHSNLTTDNTIIDNEVPDAPPNNPTNPIESTLNIDLNDQPTKHGTEGIQKIYLEDYTPPVYYVNNVELNIRLFDDYAEVDSLLVMTRQHKGDLVLLGQEMTLEQLIMNDNKLSSKDYVLDDEKLIIKNAPDDVVLSIKVTHRPQSNTALEGLYIAGEGSDAMYVTQCEPEGFRKITYYPDRPDVLSTFTTRLEASKKFTTLLANGELVETGEVEDDNTRHYAIWRDPSKKPSYLFACVFADLSVLTDSYTTIEGREVLLEIYAKDYDIDKCSLAMQALKDSMQWDEENYGRAYDLDRYMIVAVSQFNMGAMENKGLNIFNTACVLSSPETTTDARSFSVKAIIAHEYFHNWTGNRVTCRDWFQLCLKEGLTVFRDQSFSEDQQSPAVQRIDDVSLLRAHQFAEDAGPLAHPPRPDSFVEINNFYTTTVYEKGAEIVRMLANYLGDDYRKGTDTYFDRYDGQAVTVEDWLSALSVNGTSVEHFIDWYTQPGTPQVSGHQEYDAEKGVLTIHLNQQTRHIDGYAEPKPLPIPVASAVFDQTTGKLLKEQLLLLTASEQSFSIEDVFTAQGRAPVLSLLRNFSAPVQLNYQYSDDELAFLLTNETNGFNQWQSAQALVNKILLQDKDADIYLNAVKSAFLKLTKTDSTIYDPMLASRLFDIPAERELSVAINKQYEPIKIKQKRDILKSKIAKSLQDEWEHLYQSLPITAYEDTSKARGIRALRNVILDMAFESGLSAAHDWAKAQYINATCMTERFGAVYTMVQYNHKDKVNILKDFYNRFANEQLVIDLWFGVQAGDNNASINDIQSLIEHEDFDWGTPNRVRAVLGSFASQPTKLWTQEGLQLYIKVVSKLDEPNPVLASRLLQALSRWYTLAEPMRNIAKQQLTELTSKIESKNTKESLQSILKGG